MKQKCGYCGYLIRNMNDICMHSCFQNYDEDTELIKIDDNHVVTMSKFRSLFIKLSSSTWNNILYFT